MKNAVLLFLIMLGYIFSGCNRENDEQKDVTSRLVAKVSQEVTTKSGNNTDNGRVVFTGNDILWFNGMTKEIRFQNNIEQKDVISSVLNNNIQFYIDDEYLFSSMNCVSSFSSAIYDNLVFYYNILENKFYLKDGYPGSEIFSEPSHLIIRAENMQKIATEWDKFINLLKEEGRYVENPPTGNIPDPVYPDEPDTPVEPTPMFPELQPLVDSLMILAPVSSINEVFVKKYAVWTVTWNDIASSSDIRKYAESEEYADLLKFCVEKGKLSWPPVIKRLVSEKDYLATLLLTDITLPEYQLLWDEVRKNYPDSKGGNFAAAMDYSLRLLIQEKENIISLVRQQN